MKVSLLHQLIFCFPFVLGFLATASNKILVNANGRILNNDSINVFLGTTNTLWGTASNWSLGRIPNSSDRAIIRSNCSLNTDSTVSRLTVEATRTLSWESGTLRTLTVSNDYDNSGTVDMSGGGLGHTLNLNGLNLSSTGTFIAGAGVFTYGRLTDQNILNLAYNSLTFNTGSKRFLGNGTFTVGSFFQTAGNPNPNIIEKLNSGDLIVIGQLRFGNSTQLNLGSNNLELRNGLRAASTNAILICNTVRITTNNQAAEVNAGFGVTITGIFFIDNGLTFTNNLSISQAGLNVSGAINGGNASSTLINNGKVVLSTFNALMNTGVFTNNSGSLIEIAYTGNNVLPNYTYYNLTLSNSGIKSLGQNTTILTDLTTSTTGQVDISNFILTVNGITTINGNGSITSIISTGTGTLLCIGQLRGQNFSIINIGSNIIECRGGLRSNASTTFQISSPVLLTTNNQNLSSAVNASANALVLNSTLTIDNGLTATIPSLSYVIVKGVLNGNNGSSILDNRGTFEYQNATAPMVTGQLQCNNAANTFTYNRSGNQDIYSTTYRTLIFAGSGIKKLLGNIVCDSFELGSSATIDFNGFTITTVTQVHSVNGSLFTNASLLGVTNITIRANLTLVANRTFVDILNDTVDVTITFAGFTLTSTGTSSYTRPASQKVYGSANWIYNNLTLGGTAVGGAIPNNKTLQGNVSVPGTYSVTGNAIKVDNGFTFGNP